MGRKEITPEEMKRIEDEAEAQFALVHDPEMEQPEQPAAETTEKIVQEEQVITPQPENIIAATETKVENNGHAKTEAEQLLMRQQEQEELARQEEQRKRFEEEEAESRVPGAGYLVNVKKKNLPQNTRLNEREILLFSLGKLQDAIVNPNRTETAFAILTNNIMEFKISYNGMGREETLKARQQEAEKAAEAAAKGALFGK